MREVRYQVKNDQDPTLGNITEEKESEPEKFIAYAKLVMGTLGYKVFEPVVSPANLQVADLDADDEPLLYFKHRRGAGNGRRTSEGFVVLAGSHVAQMMTNRCPDTIRALRERYADRISAVWETTTDLLFTSPSAAAGFISGSSINGMTAWKDERGVMLRDLEAQA